jgi:hypothetical protein
MDPVSNVGQLVEILRKRLTESQAKTGVSTKGASRQHGSVLSGRGSVEDLQKNVSEKLRRIDASDPKARQKSVHVFLESVLLWQFGERLMDDPKFYALLDEVQHSMESDPVIRESLAKLMNQLR